MNIRQNGIYYTTLFNPFELKPFEDWARAHRIDNDLILEPFAGCNSIIDMLQSVGLAKNFQSYDVYPQSAAVQKRDTIKNYPKGYRVCITNPPWLYKASAHRRGLQFPDTRYDDVYKLCISKALEHSEYVGALIPASFIQSGLFTNRLEKIIFLNKPLFHDTENPVCLALFNNDPTKDVRVYEDNQFIGRYSQLIEYLPPKSADNDVKFNIPDGSLGFVAIDNNIAPSIRFCHGEELSGYTVGYSSRSITRIHGIDATNALIDRLNDCIVELRENTRDIFLTTFKGLRKDGKYRRRMEYALARNIIDYAR